MDEEWESVLLSKYADSDKYSFNSDELDQICDGAFSSSEIEIVELFNRAMRFSLKRETNDLLLFFDVLFSKRSSAQLFIEDVRSRQREVRIFLIFFFQRIDRKEVTYFKF